METKALKKQLGAAIAMVLVAAVALGSATYAWFVSNNTVEAKTSTVSARSNSAYLVIDNAKAGGTTMNSTSSATASEAYGDEKVQNLYPAQWANNFDADGAKAVDGNGVYQFETAYASDKDKADEKADTRFVVGNPSTAVTNFYAFLNTFYIGTGTYDGTFTNLKVDGLTVNGASDLSSAMHVLVKSGDQWVVLDSKGDIENQSGKDGIIHSAEFGKATSDVAVELYVYYDGSTDKVYTTNLDNLEDCNLVVDFSATPKEYGKATA